MIKVLLFTSVNVFIYYCLHIFLNTSTGYVLAAENSTESLFLKELKRRGISSRKSESESTAQTTTSAPPRVPEVEQRSQLEVSRALNSEGLEGLIPRAKELLKLGLSFFLAFGPLIIGIVGLALTLYFLFGTQFVHGGRSGMAMPQYVDPYELLGQPIVDPTVPLR
ncbi:g8996 [Coccomyxa elongata]